MIFMAYQFLDVLKSTENHNNWEEVTSLLTNYTKDQNEVVNSISQSLLHINNYKSKLKKQISRNDKEKSLNYIKLICKLKHLMYSEMSRNGLNCLELSSDCFRIIIVLNDVRSLPSDCIFKQILFEYNKEKPVSCPELLKSLADGCYDQLLLHIYELQMLYSVGHDKQEQLKAFLCLQSLEEDISKLSKCLITSTNFNSDSLSPIPQPNNLIGIVKTRSGGIPAQFVFYCPINAKSDVDSPSFSTFSDRFKVTLQLMSHHEKNLLPFIPLVNLQKDINGNCSPSFVSADAMKCVSLAAKFVLRLTQPLVMCDTSISSISSITGLDVITSGIHMNYIDLILSQNGSSLTREDQFFNILPNENQLIFLVTEGHVNISAQTVTSIPFLLPSQIPRIITILKKQVIINCMMESFLLGEFKSTFIQDVNNAQIVHVSIISFDYFVFSYTRPNGNFVKFSVAFNDLSQISVNFISSDKMMDQYGVTSSKFGNVIYKYNNLTMAIFWILYKSGDIFILEGFQDELETNHIPNLLDCSDQCRNSSQLIDDNQFVDQCINIAKSNLSIKSLNCKDILPKITIEPKMELLTKTPIPINTTGLSQENTNIIGKSKPALLHAQDYQTSNMLHNVCQMEGVNQSTTISTSHISSSNPVLVSPAPPPHKCESITPYNNYSTKHMNLDQMLSSDFAMPFATDSVGSLNSLSHPIHYSEHSSHSAVPISTPINNYNSHFNIMAHKKETIPKNARLYDTQSSVLVNLLNCNENTGPNNSCGFMNRQMPKNMTNPSQMSDQFEPPLMHPHMSRFPQIPRLRMPHPNPHKSGVSVTTVNTVSQRPPMPTISQSPPSKADVMMMPYPQDTGNGRAAMSRKPRKRKLSTLEMNQRLPKKPLMQPPTMRQPSVHHDMMHNPLQSIDHPMSHAASNPQSQHQQPSIASSNFSSPTTMDQSIYDFDDNIDCGRSRIISSVGTGGCGSSGVGNIGSFGGTGAVVGGVGNMPTSQSNNFNNPSVNRKFSNAASKKPLKVKISRKAISQNSGSQECKTTFVQDPESKMKEKIPKSSGNIPILSTVRSTAIMNAIDSPLTCSSLSSMQTSPHGSISVACSGMPLENIGDPSLMKKRRKRRLKSELEDTLESLKKKEKLEMRKQNRKKKELLMNHVNAQSGMSSSNNSMDMVSNTDLNIKAPLPIKLSLNAKTGSVSNNINSGSGSGSSSSNMSNNRNSKMTLPMISQSTNSNSWMNQSSNNSSNNNNSSSSNSGIGSSNALLKQSTKAESMKHHHQTSLVTKPLLKNYKIPKKKSSDPSCQVPVSFQESGKGVMHSSQPFTTKSSSANSSGNNNIGNDLMKNMKDTAVSNSAAAMGMGTVSVTTNTSCDSLKCESEQLSAMNVIEHPKTPIMLHPDAAVTLSCPSQMATSISEPDNNSTKNIHDIVDKLHASARMTTTMINSTTISSNELISVNSGGGGAIANAISDFSSTKPPPLPVSAVNNQSENNPNNASENIFEKFSSSKNNGKSDHRQFTNSRFADPSCMNMQRYPSYSRPPAGFPAPKLRPPMGAPIPYGVPRQPFMTNTNLYRMDSAPVRNFNSGNVPNAPYGPKKNPNNSFVNKKKDF